MLPIDFTGEQLELRGFLRTEDLSNFAGLWMREDDDGGPVAFDNMQARQLKGTTEWTEILHRAPAEQSGQAVAVRRPRVRNGTRVGGIFRLLVDGRPIADVPRMEPPKTVVDVDKEFDAGSGIALKDLTKTQIANLAMLGKVWGFLKVPPSAGHGRQTALGLRALPHSAAAC